MTEGWKQVHERLVALAQSKAQYDREEARWLVQGLRRAGAHPRRHVRHRNRMTRGGTRPTSTTTSSSGSWRNRSSEGPRTKAAAATRSPSPYASTAGAAGNNRCHLEVHHFDPRSEGGEHDPDRMALLCSTPHRAVHRGFLIIKGRISEGLEIRHADGTRYGLSAHPEATDIHAKAFQALRQMGYRETEARNAVDAARTQLGTHVGLEQVRRAALRAAPATRTQPGVREHVAVYQPVVATAAGVAPSDAVPEFRLH